MSSRGFSGQGGSGTGKVFRLPVRAARNLSAREAAIHLGITPRRLGILAALGTGPAQDRSTKERARYQRSTLDLYIETLHDNAGISTTETIRRRTEAAPAREEALHILRTNNSPRTELITLPPIDPFMMLATWREVCEHSVYMLLKMLALFGVIMLFISSTPLLRTHFN